MERCVERTDMPTILFAFQIIPGSDDLLAYYTTMEEAVSEAAAHRKQLTRDQALDDEYDGVCVPICLYEVRLKPLTLDLVMPVLNKRRELPDVLVDQREHVGTIE
jgi:hypothetical protein